MKETKNALICEDTHTLAGSAFRLFRAVSEPGENIIFSPLSAFSALALAAQGAHGNTLVQLEQLFALPLARAEKIISPFYREKNKPLRAASSLWLRNDFGFAADAEYIQRCAQGYDAEVKSVPFGARTIARINAWTKKKTGGMIEKIADGADCRAIAWLIAAAAFDAQWEKQYGACDLSPGSFTSALGKQQTASMMRSEEQYIFLPLACGSLEGFIKPYAGGDYLFIALIPTEKQPLEEYLSHLSFGDVINAVSSGGFDEAQTYMPRFDLSFGRQLNNALKRLGVSDAFDCDAADFSRMGKCENGNIFIGEVLQRSFIGVNEKGTRAGSAAKVEMLCKCCLPPHRIVLDRPFFFAVMHRSGFPVFMGNLCSLQDEN